MCVDKYDETIEVNNGTDVHLDKYSNNSQRSSSCKILFEVVWERKEFISTSDPNFEEELMLGIAPDESFGNINQPDKKNHKCLDSKNGPDKKNHKLLDSKNRMKVKDSNQVKNLLNENENKLKEHNKVLWSLMATNMDADDPENAEDETI